MLSSRTEVNALLEGRLISKESHMSAHVMLTGGRSSYINLATVKMRLLLLPHSIKPS